MGCHDLYCAVCGGPTYSRPVITNVKLLKTFLPRGNVYYNVEPNGLWESATQVVDFLKKKHKTLKIKKMTKKEYVALMESVSIPESHTWQDDLILITKNNVIYRNVHSAGEVFIEVGDQKYEAHEKDGDAHVIHHDCYKLIKNKYKTVTYKSINNNYPDYDGLMDQYQGQSFYSPLAYLDMPHTLESPMVNKKNKKRLLKFKLNKS